MPTALEKLITIIRLTHEAAPDMPITVRLEGPQRSEGWCVDLTLRYCPIAEDYVLDEQAMIPAAGGISCNGRRIKPGESTARIVVDMVENLSQRVSLPDEVTKLVRAKRHSPEFGTVPPDDRLKQWREWAAKVGSSSAGEGVSDVDLRLGVGERIETLKGLVEEYRKALGR